MEALGDKVIFTFEGVIEDEVHQDRKNEGVEKERTDMERENSWCSTGNGEGGETESIAI